MLRKECYNLIATVAVLFLSLSLSLSTNLIFLQHFAESFRCGSETERDSALANGGSQKSLASPLDTNNRFCGCSKKLCKHCNSSNGSWVCHLSATPAAAAQFLRPASFVAVVETVHQRVKWLVAAASRGWQPPHSRLHAPRVTNIAKAFEQHDATGNLQLATDNWQQQ